MTKILKQLWNDEAGQGLPEYALLVAAVVIMVIAATALFAEDVQNLFNAIGDEIEQNNALGGGSTT